MNINRQGSNTDSNPKSALVARHACPLYVVVFMHLHECRWVAPACLDVHASLHETHAFSCSIDMHSCYRHQKTRHWPGLSELFCSDQNSFLFSCHMIPDTGAEPARLITSSRNLSGNISFVHFSMRFRINSRYSVSASLYLQ
jgi:hypothetical protein